MEVASKKSRGRNLWNDPSVVVLAIVAVLTCALSVWVSTVRRGVMNYYSVLQIEQVRDGVFMYAERFRAMPSGEPWHAVLTKDHYIGPPMLHPPAESTPCASSIGYVAGLSVENLRERGVDPAQQIVLYESPMCVDASKLAVVTFDRVSHFLPREDVIAWLKRTRDGTGNAIDWESEPK